MQSRSTIQRAIALIAGLCLACVLVGTLAIVLRPRTFTERVDAIGYGLEQHGIAYERIYIDQGWPDQINDITYGANLLVIVPGKGQIGGRIDCKNGDHTCEIAFPRLNIGPTPVPDLTETHDMPLFTWLEARVTAIRAGKFPWE
ncbi:MAG: hypothetical protein SH847_02395 [Roseiflexaceae bacterium]|nr:hypothetical protein [Roseiflexaceae bacterium]